jgi:flagellin
MSTAYDGDLAVGQQGTGVDTSAIAAGEVTIAVGTGSAVAVAASTAGSGAGQTAGSAWSKAAAINGSGLSGLTATADTTLVVAWDDVNDSAYSLEINDVAIYTNYDGAVTTLTGTAFAAAVNANSSATGVTASYDSATGNMTLAASDGRDIKTEQTIGATGTANLGLNGTGAGTNNATNAALAYNTAADGNVVTRTAVGSIRLTAAESITIGGSTPARIGFGVGGSLALGNEALSSASVTTVANANTAITRVDAALSTISSMRGSLGAIQNRFESTINNLQSVSENLSASRSRIQDADFAAETALLTRAQILQQAGTAILAQANAVPQNVLSLLR